MQPPPDSTRSATTVTGCFHRARTEEWSNYDSSAEEMRSIFYNYVEALYFADDGQAYGMVKIGTFPLDPADNGAARLDPEDPGSYNLIGRWSISDGRITADLEAASKKPTLSARWVGIFYLPGTLALSNGRLDGETLHAGVRYDKHPIWDGPTKASYHRLAPERGAVG